MDSYTYGVTPGISAGGVWGSNVDPPISESYVVCHRDAG